MIYMTVLLEDRIMLRHYIDITDNTYIIENDGTIVFSINLTKDDGILVRSPNDVYTGKIEDISIGKR